MTRRSPLVPLLAVAALVFGAGPAVHLATDAAWFDAHGLGALWWRIFAVRAGLFLGGALLALTIVGGSLARALAVAPASRPAPRPKVVSLHPEAPTAPELPVDALARAAVAAVALISGLGMATAWDEVLPFVYRQPMGYVDPVWGLDASFYVFVLPVVQLVRGSLATLTLLSLVGAVAVYVLRGAVQVDFVQEGGQLRARSVSVPGPVKAHVALITTALMLLVAAGTWLRRYTLLYDPAGLFAGPGYADLHGTLPLLAVQAVATAAAAVLAGLAIHRASALPGFIAGAMWTLSAAAANLYPDLLQRLSVDPNELTREGPQMVHHIRATRWAFELDRVEELPLTGEADLDRADIEANAGTIENVPLWDHRPLLQTFGQVQEIRTYYEFGDVDNDRYVIDGRLRQVMLSPRELPVSSLPAQARTWVNEAMTYTHGYGLTLGPVNEVTPQGLPTLWVKDLPPQVAFPDDLRIDRPQIYFGEAMERPVLVGTANPEFDYPSGDDNAYTRYAGHGGVALGNPFWRGLWAWRLGWTDLLFSSDVSSETRVLLYRNVRERVRTIAPFLEVDRDPYMVIDEGRLVWVLDAYTTSDRAPYSTPLRGLGNYLRNPVKVTVDAYDGTTTFFLMQPDEPIAAAWNAALPGLFTPGANLPESLRAHLRVPTERFAVQASLFATYHMEEPQIFYNREDEWEPPVVGERRMAPYFTVMKLPGTGQEEFILMLPFTPKSKNNLAAWMVARNDGEAYGQLRVYKFPKDKMVYGPNMVMARINQDDAISEKMSLWNQQGSAVELGPLLVIPIEESLIYVQALYLRAASGSIPELKRVIVAHGDDIAMAPTLEEGLAEIFGSTEAREIAPTVDDVARPAPADDGLAPSPALAAWRAARAAAAAGDWVGFGAAMDALGQALEASEASPAAD